MHVIAKHQFPKYYDFFIVNDGIDKRNSMLRSSTTHRRRSSAAINPPVAAVGTANASKPEAQQRSPNADNEHTSEKTSTSVERSRGDLAMDEITTSMSTLKFVPPSVRFGRGRGKGGLARRQIPRTGSSTPPRTLIEDARTLTNASISFKSSNNHPNSLRLSFDLAATERRASTSARMS